MKTITLYYADWCGHCKAFKPEWEKLKTYLEKEENIITSEFESDKDKKEIEKAGITGFPTIKITINGKTTDYTGQRTVKDILKAIGISYNKSTQSGGYFQNGGAKINYYKKYIKYKKKYIAELKLQKNE